MQANFILQQGLDAPSAENCPLAYSSLHFQPRVVGSIVGFFSLVIAALLTLDHRRAAITMEIIFLGAVAALVFGGLCFGSYVFHLLKGQQAFANRTLPWSRVANEGSARDSRGLDTGRER